MGTVTPLTPMTTNKDKLSNMFTRVAAGTVTREEGAMLLNSMARSDPQGTLAEIRALIEKPPANVKPETVLLTVSQARNKAFFDVIVGSLEDAREEVAVMAAEELGSSRSEAARLALTERLDCEDYKTRKTAAAALARHFGQGAIDALRARVEAGAEEVVRVTSAYGLLHAGPRGHSALAELMSGASDGAAAAAIEAVSIAPDAAPDAVIPVVVDALFRAGDAGDAVRVMKLLKAVSSFKARAAGFADAVRAFTDHQSEGVRGEAVEALRKLGASA